MFSEIMKIKAIDSSVDDMFKQSLISLSCYHEDRVNDGLITPEQARKYFITDIQNLGFYVLDDIIKK